MPAPPLDDLGTLADLAFQRIWQRRRLSAGDLGHVVRAAAAGVRVSYLAKLAGRHPPPVLEAVRALYDAGDPAARAAAVGCLRNRMGREDVGGLLRRAMVSDPEADVREAAAWAAVRLFRHDLAGEVTALAGREAGPRGERLRLLAATLRDGYALEVFAGGDGRLSVLTPRSNFLQVFVPREALASPGGLAARLADVRRWRVR